MGAIHISNADFYESLSEILGCKSGLVLDRQDIVALLAEDEQLAEFAELKDGGGLRIRSEVFEDVVDYLLYRVGRLEQRGNVVPEAALFHRYKRDPEKLKIALDIGDRFKKYCVEQLSIPDLKILEPGPFITAMEKRYGMEGTLIALQYVEGLHVRLVRSPWGPDTMAYRDTIELKHLFESERLDPLYGKFIDQRYIDFLFRNFNRIDKMNWRKFEGLTGEFFDRQGFHVELGAGRNDGGIDARVWPTKPSDDHPPMIIAQCKRQKETVQKLVVKALYADVLSEKAESGLIVTTSRLSAGAAKVLKARNYPIGQADRQTLKAWIENLRQPGAGWFL